MKDKKQELSAHVEEILSSMFILGFTSVTWQLVVASHIPLVNSPVNIIPSILSASSFCVFRTSS